jgi:hypothetical protein
MDRANLQPAYNLWYAVYDFNDPSKTGKNWSLVDQKDEEETWCPIEPCQNCCPRVKVGSIPLPSQSIDPNMPASSGGMTR